MGVRLKQFLLINAMGLASLAVWVGATMAAHILGDPPVLLVILAAYVGIALWLVRLYSGTLEGAHRYAKAFAAMSLLGGAAGLLQGGLLIWAARAVFPSGG